MSELIDKKLYKKDDRPPLQPIKDDRPPLVEKERYADRAAHKAEELHEEEQKEALIRYISSSAKIDPQDLMEYIDSLKQSEGAEESQISKGRTK